MPENLVSQASGTPQVGHWNAPIEGEEGSFPRTALQTLYPEVPDTLDFGAISTTLVSDKNSAITMDINTAVGNATVLAKKPKAERVERDRSGLPLLGMERPATNAQTELVLRHPKPQRTIVAEVAQKVPQSQLINNSYRQVRKHTTSDASSIPS